MSLIYITGPAGSGKTTVKEELLKRQYQAYDEDDSDIGSARNKQTGQAVKILPVDKRTPEWFDKHEWRISSDAFDSLKQESKNKLVFLCGNAATKQQQGAFDKIIFLDIDEETLMKRLATRADNDFGQSEEELRMVLKKKQELKKALENKAIFIDPDQPIEHVVSKILRIAN